MRLDLLLKPLDRLVALNEQNNAMTFEIHQVITVDLKKAANEGLVEMKKHTALLTDIKELLKKQIKEKNQSTAPKVKLPSLMSGVGVGLAIITMAAALVAAAGIFSLMPSVSPLQLLTAIAIGGVFLILAPVFTSISESLRGGGLYERIVGKTDGVSSGISGTKDLLKITGGTGLAMIMMAIGITASSFIFSFMSIPSIAQIAVAFLVGFAMIPISYAFGQFYKQLAKNKINLNRGGIEILTMTGLAMIITAGALVGIAYILNNMPSVFNNPPPLEWTLKVGLALLVFSLPFYLIMKAVKGASIKELAFGVLALPLIAVGILGIAWVFNYLSEVEAYNAPPIEWTLKAGLALFVFGIPFALITTVIKSARIGIKELILGTVAIAAISLAILGVAWIFSLLSDVNFISPPLEWAMSSAIAITVFAIPVMLLSAFIVATGGTGALALLGGIIGIVLIAGAMWAVAWIFSMMPDLSSISKNITNALMVPVNAMVDILKRFKDEIGIENLLPLAGGLVAVAGGWLALVGALAGQSIGGLASSIANLGTAIFDGISSLFGGSKTQTPIDLLDALISREPGITKLIKPMKQIGSAFQMVSMSTPLVIKGVSAFGKFLVEDNAENFERSAKASTELAKAYAKFSAASKTMNVKAIQASTQMFNALTKLAEADGEDAMTVLADKLLQAVKELSEITVDLQEAITAQGAATTGVGDVISGALGRVTEVVTAATDKAKKMVGDAKTDAAQIDLQPVVEALEEIKDRFDMPIYTKEITL